MKWSIISDTQPQPTNQPKRKNKQSKAHESKKQKTTTEEYQNIDDLEWRQIECSELPFTEEGAGGFHLFEEIDGVDVDIIEGPNGGRVVQFKKVGDQKEKRKVESKEFKKKKEQKKKENEVKKKDSEPQEKAEPKKEVEQEVDISAWEMFNFHESILNSIKRKGFTSPTEIQQKSLPLTLFKKRNLIGISETGSGKTLAYGLPILQHFLNVPDKKGIRALIFVPTRELAIQVRNHLSEFTLESNLPKPICLIGGLSQKKQERLLKQQPSLLIATPGRFLEVMNELGWLQSLKDDLDFLVLDEVDRMIEKGHFQELDVILGTLKLKQETTVNEWQLENGQMTFIEEEKVKRQKDQEIVEQPKRQTFVFSATFMEKNGKKKQEKSLLELLLEKVEMENPSIIDLTHEQFTNRNLIEAKIECLEEQKDLFLYYFISLYPGRTLVFVNSISQIKRLLYTFSFLQCPVYGLHAQMQQKQRLKNLERFSQSERGVLICSDVAARGLDIKGVQHVLHYHLPRTAELYVHRSGRTARAKEDGISISLIAPQEHELFQKLSKSLHKIIQTFPIDSQYLNPLRHRLQLSKEIEKLHHQTSKKNHNDKWIQKMKQDLEVDSDSDHENDSYLEKKKKKEYEAKKHELKQLLSEPIIPKGIKKNFLTMNSGDLLKKMSAGKDLQQSLLPSHTALDRLLKK